MPECRKGYGHASCIVIIRCDEFGFHPRHADNGNFPGKPYFKRNGLGIRLLDGGGEGYDQAVILYLIDFNCFPGFIASLETGYIHRVTA